MDKNTFETYFRCFENTEGQKVGKGSLDNAYTAALYAEQVNKVSMETICKKWQQYIEECIQKKTADQYIMSMESFIDKQRYNNDFGGTLKTKQASFLDKYADNGIQMKEVTNETMEEKKVAQYLIGLEEGEFSLEESSEEDRVIITRVMQIEKLSFFKDHSFVIKKTGEWDYKKIKL
jgi:hypothetical protein